MKRKLLSLVLVLVFLLTAIPAATAEPEVPSQKTTYNLNDYNKVRDFLELSDSYGVKNGYKIRADYDKNDPETWYCVFEEDDYVEYLGFTFDAYDGSAWRLDFANIWELGMVGELDLSYCSYLSELYASYNGLTGLDIEYCSNLDGAFCSDNQLEWVAFSGCDNLSLIDLSCNYIAGDFWARNFQQLEYFDISSNMLESLEVSNCGVLTTLNCYWNDIYELDLSGDSSLNALYCDYNQLDELDVSDLTELKYLYCTGNLLTSLDVSNNVFLKELWLDSNYLTSIDLTENTELEELDVYENELTSLDVSKCTDLYYLSCGYNRIGSLDVTKNTQMNYLYVDGNELTSIDLSRCPYLYNFSCDFNPLTSLDLSACPYIEYLSCIENLLTELDLSHNENIPRDRISAQGPGTIGYSFAYYYDEYDDKGHRDEDYEIEEFAYSSPADGAEFIGWFDNNGHLLDDRWMFDLTDCTQTRIVAKYEYGELLPGDADRNGAVDTADALLVLRCSLGITDNADELLVNCDLDGGGTINTTDALIVLRIALGIAS